MEIKPGLGQGQDFPRQGLGGFVKCICPKCGYIIEHRRNMPCSSITCPKCKIAMVGTNE